MVKPTVQVGDQIEILVDNACGTDETKGARLIIKEVSSTHFITPALKHAWTWSFTIDDFIGNKIKHIPQMTLPTGYHFTSGAAIRASMGYDNFYEPWGSYEPKKEEEKPKIKCECGMSAVAGHEGDNPEIHSSFCPVYKPKEKK